MNCQLPAALALCFLALTATPQAAPFDFLRSTAPPPEDRDTIVQVQAFLDELLFGPGIIDGKLGEFTTIAATNYNVRWRVAEDNWYRLLKEARRHVKEPYTTYTVLETDLRYVGDFPAEPDNQVGLDYLPYRSLAEFVSERFHTSTSFLAEINPNLNVHSLRPGDRVRVPNVSPFQLELIKPHHQYTELEPLSSNMAFVDTKAKIVKIMNPKGETLASFPITPGQEKFIPYGDWKIQIMVTTPTFRWDKKMLEEGERSEEYFMLPPGPNSPVGIFWAGLNKSGIGLHGTSSPETIGRSRSAGCIRLANWDALRLRSLLRPGATVMVR